MAHRIFWSISHLQAIYEFTLKMVQAWSARLFSVGWQLLPFRQDPSDLQDAHTMAHPRPVRCNLATQYGSFARQPGRAAPHSLEVSRWNYRGYTRTRVPALPPRFQDYGDFQASCFQACHHLAEMSRRAQVPRTRQPVRGAEVRYRFRLLALGSVVFVSLFTVLSFHR